MSDTADFGDITTEDVWDADATIAPEQVTYRLHQLRAGFDALGGRDTPDWDDLAEDEQQLALAIGEVIVGWIEERDDEPVASLARKIHNVQAYLCGGLMPPWEELSAAERSIGRRIVQMILDWLRREGDR